MKHIITKIKKGLCWVFDNPIFNAYLLLIGAFVMVEGVIQPLVASPNFWYNIVGYMITFIIGILFATYIKNNPFRNKD